MKMWWDTLSQAIVVTTMGWYTPPQENCILQADEGTTAATIFFLQRYGYRLSQDKIFLRMWRGRLPTANVFLLGWGYRLKSGKIFLPTWWDSKTHADVSLIGFGSHGQDARATAK